MSDHNELKKQAEEILEIERLHPCGSTRVILVNPATVLELFADIERLKTLRSTTERDLAQELEVWKGGPSCWNCMDTGDVHDLVGEWRGKCDCFAAQMIDVSSERDQLKAENEALRKDAERYQWLRDKSEALHSFYLSVPIWMTGVKFKKESVDISIDAAIKQGEQS